MYSYVFFTLLLQPDLSVTDLPPIHQNMFFVLYFIEYLFTMIYFRHTDGMYPTQHVSWKN